MDNKILKERANGNWFGILRQSGIQEKYLKNKHCPCPLCGGKDRYRWDNLNGDGNYYCNQCGPGNGFQLIQRFHNWSFGQTAQFVENCVGSENPIIKTNGDYGKEQDFKEAEKARAFIENIIAQTVPIQEGDMAYQYLKGRGLNEIPQTLFYHPSLFEVSTKKYYEGLIAPITSPEGKIIALQRTFLKDGKKAPIENPRQMTKVIEKTNKSAIRLFKPERNRLAITEGTETGLAVHELYKTPVWSVISTSGMKSFIPPEGIETLGVFVDNDVAGIEAGAFLL